MAFPRQSIVLYSIDFQMPFVLCDASPRCWVMPVKWEPIDNSSCSWASGNDLHTHGAEIREFSWLEQTQRKSSKGEWLLLRRCKLSYYYYIFMFKFCTAEFFNKNDDAGLAIVDSSLQSDQHAIVKYQGNKTKKNKDRGAAPALGDW